MAEFDSRERIEGLVCKTSAVGGLTERLYQVVFERGDATIDQIEKISWKRPNMNEYCKLPTGFAFNLKDISYRSRDKSYVVTLILREQYLGDVTRYQDEIKAKDDTIHTMETNHAATVAEKDSTINNLNSQLAEADETIVTMETQLAEADDTIIAMSAQLEEADQAMIELFEQVASSTETPSDGTEEPPVEDNN